MNNKELAVAISKKMNCPISNAKKFVEAFAEAVIETNAAGEPVRVTAFGTFSPKAKAARDSYSPAKKEIIKIPAFTTVKFVAAKAYKDALNAK